MSSLCPGKPWQTRLSSAGLVYLHFGHRILTQLLPSPMEDQVLSTLYDKIYENLIEEVDAVDNGISTHDGEPRYRVTTTLSARVKRLNPGWNEPLKEPEDSRFQKAVELVGEEFTDRVQYFTSSWLPARSLVQQALERRLEVDPSGEIMELAQGGCPWQDHLFSLESESGQVKYLIFPDTTGSWRVQAVPIFPGSFNLRKPLKWCGLRGEKLSEACGIPGCIFVHVTGFIGGHSTRDGALALAKLSLS
ncbi:C12orf10 [Cordylochernes scorpioides]|uniref:C12orf10 n=1 Tax=Cordylochernes scorpioides TaxID=51811 RepID=A0ABY6KP71_9ARAC|nr:C12orf10 [Cordylochernes scorpioides]